MGSYHVMLISGDGFFLISNECDVCGMPQTIEHLLFSCDYVRPLWRVVQSVF